MARSLMSGEQNALLHGMGDWARDNANTGAYSAAAQKWAIGAAEKHADDSALVLGEAIADAILQSATVGLQDNDVPAFKAYFVKVAEVMKAA